MSTLNVRQRHALRYAVMKAEGDRDLRAAELLRHAHSSTPSLQRFFESPHGVVLMLVVGLAIFALFAPVGSF
jgi:hypothetical protein